MSNYGWKKVEKMGVIDFEDAIENWSSAVDPYLIWAYLTDFEYLRQPTNADKNTKYEFIPITIELKQKSVKEFVEYIESSDKPSVIVVSDLYRNTPLALEKARFLTAYAHIPIFFEELKVGGVLYQEIERFELGLAIEPFPLSLTKPPYHSRVKGLPDDKPLGELVTNLAVIDDGIGFVNNTVRGKNGKSRLKYFWNQDPITDSDAKEKSSSIKSELGVKSYQTDLDVYGWELDYCEIDQWFKIIEKNLISEAGVYSTYSYYAVGQSVSHGTHILDKAVGFSYSVDSRSTVSVESRLDATNIVAVQLAFPSRKFADSSGRWLSYGILDAVRYSLLRGDQLPDTNGNLRPMVVNISMGNLAGPHDGSSVLESAIDDLLSLRNNQINPSTGKARENSLLECVMSSGNQRLARAHAKLQIKPNKYEELCWRILPDDSTPSFVELWLPDTHSDSVSCKDISLELIPPRGEALSSGELKCGEIWSFERDSISLCTVVYLPPEKMATGRNGMILVALSPTNSILNKHATEPGEWKVVLRNNSEQEVAISAWIQRDETTFDRPIRGRQSRFVDSTYERYEKTGHLKSDDGGNKSYIRYQGTVSAIATGNATRTIGAYRFSDNEESKYSGLGGDGVKFALPMAVADDSTTCLGALASGTFSGSKVSLDGTSVSAAQATRSLISGEFKLTSDNSRIVSSKADDSSKKRRIGYKVVKNEG